MKIPETNSIQMMQAAGATPAANRPARSASAIPETFGNALGRERKTHQTKEEQAYDAAGDLVSNALILPVLEQLRRGSLAKNTIFEPGIAENTFGPEFDIQIADRIAHSHNMTCTKAIAERLLNHGKPVSRIKRDAKPAAAEEVNKEVNRVEIYG